MSYSVLFLAGYGKQAQKYHQIASYLLESDSSIDIHFLTWGVHSYLYLKDRYPSANITSFESIYSCSFASLSANFKSHPHRPITNTDIISDRVLCRSYHDEFFPPAYPHSEDAIQHAVQDFLSTYDFDIVITIPAASLPTVLILKWFHSHNRKVVKITDGRIPQYIFLSANAQDSAYWRPIKSTSAYFDHYPISSVIKRLSSIRPSWAETFNSRFSDINSLLLRSIKRLLPPNPFALSKLRRSTTELFPNCDLRDPIYFVFDWSFLL